MGRCYGCNKDFGILRAIAWCTACWDKEVEKARARKASSRAEDMTMWREARMRPSPRPVYRILARDVVLGMLLHPAGGAVVKISRNGLGEIVFDCSDGSAYEGAPGVVTAVTLPGPSPRELCCTCPTGPGFGGRQCNCLDGRSCLPCRAALCQEPTRHSVPCPVAPVPGLHGGMRLWPAPWNGAPVKWDGIYYVSGPFPLDPAMVAAVSKGAAGTRLPDKLMEMLFHPPQAQEPECVNDIGWAPHAGFEDESVRWG